ncbi:hypothetical protein LAZ67_12001097 [Cordylochernes scorpioides]|uniref:Reverse transcriptase domain-containing protein n=1 Tax=Cordylochernes scorpioides TaxID=51811 RepID=A0ABY6L1T2_9ARAC|nr:hypothetical protein LAZ67_12001097 [Cordylochernes scorpioides]
MEKIILRRLTYHPDTRNLLPEEQYGFRKGHGTIDQLLFFTQKTWFPKEDPGKTTQIYFCYICDEYTVKAQRNAITDFVLVVFSSSTNNPLYDESEDTTQNDIELDDSDSENFGEKECPKRFSQPKLNDLTRDLRLSKQDAELLASRFIIESSFNHY